MVWTASEGQVTSYLVRVLDGVSVEKSVTTVTIPQATVSFPDMKNGHRYNVLITAKSQFYEGSNSMDSEEYYMQIKTVVMRKFTI